MVTADASDHGLRGILGVAAECRVDVELGEGEAERAIRPANACLPACPRNAQCLSLVKSEVTKTFRLLSTT